jgi:hypothetical protein
MTSAHLEFPEIEHLQLKLVTLFHFESSSLELFRFCLVTLFHIQFLVVEILFLGVLLCDSLILQIYFLLSLSLSLASLFSCSSVALSARSALRFSVIFLRASLSSFALASLSFFSGLFDLKSLLFFFSLRSCYNFFRFLTTRLPLFLLNTVVSELG